MRDLNAGILLIFFILISENTIDVMSIGLLRAFVSPPMPRFTLIKDGDPRDLRAKDPYAAYDFLGLVKQRNYPAEEHNVTTEDGYRLTLHRIPDSPNSRSTKRKIPILIQHGLAASSDSWVLYGPEQDLAFLLADAGYDVWIGNFRGNTYSRSHVVLNPEEPAFWQFSFHEMGYYDLPALIDYIIKQTARKNLVYIGHSMGTTSSYVLLSTRPEYNKRLRLVVSLAPVANWNHKIEGLQKILADAANLIEAVFRSQGIFELFPQSRINRQLATSLCSDAITQVACAATIFSLSGSDYLQFNLTSIPSLTSYFPAGLSLKTLYHYYQNLIRGELTQYDYGYSKNLAHYGQSVSPGYDLSKITAPVALYYGPGDLLSQEGDSKSLLQSLPNVISATPVPYKSFNHLDFIWAINAKSLLYDDLINLIQRFK